MNPSNVSKDVLPTAARRRAHVASRGRREQILDRASELATETGLGQLTMKRIAARVGFSESAIYRHFPTKQDLLLGLMGRLETQLLDPIRAMAELDNLGPLARLQRILQHHLSLVLQRHSLPIQLLAEASAAGDPLLLSRMRGIMRAYADILTRLGNEAIVRNELPADTDAAVLAVWLLGGPAAMAIHHRLGVDPDLERRVEGALVPFTFHLLDSSAE